MANVTPSTPTSNPAVTSAKPVWACKIQTPPKDQKGYTVGEVFGVECSGTSAGNLKEPLQVKLAEKEQYNLFLLKPLAVTENQVTYMATSYRAGKKNIVKAEVADAEGNGFVIENLSFEVQSLVAQMQPPPEQPYGPMLPLPMPWPTWVFIAPLVVLGVLVLWLALFLRRRVQRKILEKNIRKFQTPLGSYSQFSKDLRALKRGVVFGGQWPPGQVETFLNTLEEDFRLFLLREFIVPATTWTARAVIQGIRKKDPRGYEKYRNVLQKAFNELERAKANAATISSKDCEQLSQICFQAVDLIWKTKKGNERARDMAQQDAAKAKEAR